MKKNKIWFNKIPRNQREYQISALILFAFCAGMVIFVSFPLVTLTLESKGVTTGLIGLILSTTSLAVLLVCVVLPRVSQSLDILSILLVGAVLTACGMLAFPFASGPIGWIAARLMVGFGGAVIWILTETWINTLARQNDRGKIVGLYATFFAAGGAIGPLLLQKTGLVGMLPWMVIAGLILAGILPVFLTGRAALPLLPSHATSLVLMVKRIPTILMIALISGFCEVSLFSMLPIYGVRIGLSPEEAALLLTSFIVGNIALQLPLGLFLDRFNQRWILVLCALSVAGIGLIVPVIDQKWVLHLCLFFWGGTVFGFYTIGLVVLGKQVPAHCLAVANAAFIMLYETGAMLGPIVTGSMMERFNDTVMPLPSIIAALLLALWVGWFGLNSLRPEPVSDL